MERRERMSERDRMSDRDGEVDRERYDEERRGSELARREYGGTSMMGQNPGMTPGFEMMRRMMRDFFGRGSAMSMPPVEIFERNGRMIVRADLPGMKREDVKVRVMDDALLLEGERRSERERDASRHEGYYESEFHYGRFSRRIPLPGRVDPSQVRARFQNGVLEVEVPCETPRTREIPIEIDREMAGASDRGR